MKTTHPFRACGILFVFCAFLCGHSFGAPVSTNKTFILSTNNVLPPNETNFFSTNVVLLEQALLAAGWSSSGGGGGGNNFSAQFATNAGQVYIAPGAGLTNAFLTNATLANPTAINATNTGTTTILGLFNSTNVSATYATQAGLAAQGAVATNTFATLLALQAQGSTTTNVFATLLNLTSASNGLVAWANNNFSTGGTAGIAGVGGKGSNTFLTNAALANPTLTNATNVGPMTASSITNSTYAGGISFGANPLADSWPTAIWGGGFADYWEVSNHMIIDGTQTGSIGTLLYVGYPPNIPNEIGLSQFYGDWTGNQNFPETIDISVPDFYHPWSNQQFVVIGYSNRYAVAISPNGSVEANIWWNGFTNLNSLSTYTADIADRIIYCAGPGQITLPAIGPIGQPNTTKAAWTFNRSRVAGGAPAGPLWFTLDYTLENVGSSALNVWLADHSPFMDNSTTNLALPGQTGVRLTTDGTNIYPQFFPMTTNVPASSVTGTLPYSALPSGVVTNHNASAVNFNSSVNFNGNMTNGSGQGGRYYALDNQGQVDGMDVMFSGTVSFVSEGTFDFGVGEGDTTGTINAGHLNGALAISDFNSGTGASSSTYWRGDGTWATPSGSGSGVATSNGFATNVTIVNQTNSGAYIGTSLNGYFYFTPYHYLYHTNFYATNINSAQIILYTNNFAGTNLADITTTVLAQCPTNSSIAFCDALKRTEWPPDSHWTYTAPSSQYSGASLGDYNSGNVKGSYFTSTDSTNYWHIQADVEVRICAP
ncbi:MAG: hypothetical protein ABSG59_10170 [Verrucomicrobiota bacterium]